jgi:hypothetical protein
MRLLGQHAGGARVDRSVAEARKGGARVGRRSADTCCQARLEVAVSSALATAASFGVEARSAKRSALREVVR